MAIAQATPVKAYKHRGYKPNGTFYRKLAGDYPRFFILEDGSVDELTHQERAYMQFRRQMSPDLQAEFDKVLVDDGRPLALKLAEFDAKMSTRSAELFTLEGRV